MVLAASLTTAALAQPDEAPRGALLYRTYCALCHGERGQGYVADHANALFHDDFLAAASDDFLTQAVVRGRPGTPMSAWGSEYGGPMSDEDVAVLVAFLRGQQGAPQKKLHGGTVQGDPLAGRTVYDARCAACHGAEGQGVTAVSLNNPVFLETASDGYIRDAVVHGRAGTPMTAFGDLLGESAIDDLTALVRSWARDVGPAPAAAEAGSPVLNPGGPAPSFAPLRQGRYVPAAEVAAALEQGARMVLLDARPPSDWRALRIPGSIPAPFYDVDAVSETLPRDGTWIVCYCGCPHAASGQVMDALRAEGFENTAVLDEGVFVWEQLGHPTEGG